MTHRTSCLALMLALVAAGCSKSTTAPTTPAVPKYTATLSPANEVPPITNTDATGTGTATITLNVTKDSAGNITAATADFTVTLSGFPANEALTAAHIHNGRAGANAGVVVPVLASGEVTVSASGSASFTKTGLNVDTVTAQNMLNDPAGFYFNVHTTQNTGGAARGQLVRTQ